MEVRRLPQLDADNRAFWTRGALGELAICRCSECRTWIHPPSAACFRCGGTALAFEAVSGYGTVVSFSVNHQAWVPGQVVPFAMAVVELDEQPGLWLTTNIVGCEPAQVRIGQRVRVRFEQHDDVWLPMFEPAA
jgi:uncharacterized OB-fold protein